MLGANLYFGRGTGLRSTDVPGATAPAVDAASQSAPAADLKSIAVLPFVDMSAAKDQEYLADGISEELLNGLVKLPGLRVAARTSAFKFKGEKVDISEVGAKLNVDRSHARRRTRPAKLDSGEL